MLRLRQRQPYHLIVLSRNAHTYASYSDVPLRASLEYNANMQTCVGTELSDPHWLVLCVASQREQFVRRWLGEPRRDGDRIVAPARFPAWAPGYRIPARKHGLRELWRPMLPGYLFVRASLERHREELLRTPEVLGLVPFGRPWITDAEFDMLHALEAAGGVPCDVQPGRTVTFRIGAVTWRGIVQAMRGQHVDVAIDILNRPVRFTIDRSALRR